MAFTLIIRERSNSWAGRPPVTSQHSTRTEAQAELLGYVRSNWDAEVGTEQPDDPDAVIAEYFEEVLESYDIVEQPETAMAS